VSWVRIDDRFPTHPKIAQLSDREFRVHVRVLCYTAMFRTEGVIPTAAFSEIPGLTPRLETGSSRLRLWDRDDEGCLRIPRLG
jgi:hypothetical protein